MARNFPDELSRWVVLESEPSHSMGTCAAYNNDKGYEYFKMINSKNCLSRSEIFAVFSSAFAFPWYFNDNWDSFFECISELDNLLTAEYGIFFYNSESALDAQPYIDLIQLLSTLDPANDKAIGKIVFQVSPSGSGMLKSILTKLNLPYTSYHIHKLPNTIEWKRL